MASPCEPHTARAGRTQASGMTRAVTLSVPCSYPEDNSEKEVP